MITKQKSPLKASFTKPIIRGGDFIKGHTYLNVSASEAEASEIERNIGRYKRETYIELIMGVSLILLIALAAGIAMIIISVIIYFLQGGELVIDAIASGAITFVASAVPLALCLWFKRSLARDIKAWKFAKREFVRQLESRGSVVEMKLPHEVALAETLELKFRNINHYLSVLGRSDSDEVQPEMKNVLEALEALVSLPQPQEVPSDIKARSKWSNPIISLFIEKIKKDAKAKEVGVLKYQEALKTLVDKEVVLYAESSMKEV